MNFPMEAEWAAVGVAVVAIAATAVAATWNWTATRAAKERDESALGLDAVREQLAARDSELGALQVMFTERTKHTDLRFDSVTQQIDKVDEKVDKLSDKMDIHERATAQNSLALARIEGALRGLNGKKKED